MTPQDPTPGDLWVHAPDGVGEVRPGDDLADLLPLLDLRDGDVVAVTSKVISKAEGRVSSLGRDAAVLAETVRVVARRGATSIVVNHLGLTMAAAGVDASNVPRGQVLLLPLDPDASARQLREVALRVLGVNVAVVVTDTAGRPWRTGQTDLAIGVAGLEPVESLAGQVDPHGNPLAVTAPAVADEVAAASDLVTGKLLGRPLAVVRGLGGRVLPAGEHGPGAVAVLRPVGEDMFALGAREAVVAALAGRDASCFGAPATLEDLVATGAELGLDLVREGPDRLRLDGSPTGGVVRAGLLAFAHGWTLSGDGPTCHLHPAASDGDTTPRSSVP